MSDVNRRRFIGAAAASAAFTIVPRHVLGGPKYVAPSDKITMAHIGVGTQGIGELGYLLGDPAIQIIAVCDPNADSSDYLEWSKGSIRKRIRGYLENPTWRENDNGCPGGREIGREIVNTYYAKQRAADKFKACAVYADFRELLDQEKDLDAVKIMTPDHLHATISIAAMRKGKHVIMHKPLANRMYEARLVIETARQTKVATHLLAWGAAPGNAMIAARINEGAVGRLLEIHNWTNRPVWPQYTEIPTETPPVPAGLDWDLWLGPALARPYHRHYTHGVFRGWYDFGGGSMADMGIYSLWPVFAELGLSAPVSAEAWATHNCELVDQVSRSIKNNFSYPTACAMRFKFAPRRGAPPLELFWYDGGMRPRLPKELEAANAEVSREGILFIGEKGSIMAGYFGENPVLYTRHKHEPLFAASGVPKEETDPVERNRLWRSAFQGGPESPGSFLNTGPISETVTLGTIALRSGQKVVFDSANMKITNVAAANQYMYREYRQGWELKGSI
ncbi:MAG TPA: Gfo/Idh/MocA family oxidoreductase [Acidobacteriaceae bacterium]|nr:Gfo/Idh/MocA family oxidoreductase [Acidobacteriaceae bacterium]HUO30314.1 Gfo/Idh/MocA family oxidoreductase [Bryobacteraceae bacterium]